MCSNCNKDRKKRIKIKAHIREVYQGTVVDRTQDEADIGLYAVSSSGVVVDHVG
jgi:hypothetical protein